MKVLIFITGLTLGALIGLAVGDYYFSSQDSLGGRISMLEEKIAENYAPRIQVNRASIYNTEGEIVVETIPR